MSVPIRPEEDAAMLDRIYRTAAEYLFPLTEGTVFRFHRSFRDGYLYDWIRSGSEVRVVRYAFDKVCPERFDFCAATLVQAFAGELLRRPLQPPDSWAERYVFCASLLARPVTEIGPELTD
jgi:hypothetical protein